MIVGPDGNIIPVNVYVPPIVQTIDEKSMEDRVVSASCLNSKFTQTQNNIETNANNISELSQKALMKSNLTAENGIAVTLNDKAYIGIEGETYGKINSGYSNACEALQKANTNAENIATISNVAMSTRELVYKKANANDVAQNYSGAVKSTKTGKAVAINDISPIAHKVNISGTAGDSVVVYGKNLLGQGNLSINNAGLTMSKQDDGSLLLNGTATSSVYIYLQTRISNPFKNMAVGDKLYCPPMLKSGTISGNIALYMGYENAGANIGIGTVPYTVTQEFLDANWVSFWLWLPIGKTATNAVVAPMLNLTNDSEYEPYVSPKTISLANGQVTTDSMPNMTFFSSGNDITATVNLDTNTIINKLITDNTALKSAVVALGGTI